MDNWDHLSKFFKKNNIDIQFADYDPVIHNAPHAAYNLLKKIYTILTDREIKDGLEIIQEQYLRDEAETMPEYAKHTIAKKLKDKELQRVADKTTMMGKAQGVVNEHVEERKVIRHETGFMNTKKTGNFAAMTMRAQERE